MTNLQIWVIVFARFVQFSELWLHYITELCTFQPKTEHLFVLYIKIPIQGVNLVNMHEKIIFLCENRGISAARLCKEINIPRSTLSELKCGRTKSLSTQTLAKIAKYFGVTMGYFDSSDDKVEEMRDQLFEKRKLLFDMSARATEDQLDALLVMLKSIDTEEGV